MLACQFFVVLRGVTMSCPDSIEKREPLKPCENTAYFMCGLSSFIFQHKMPGGYRDYQVSDTDTPVT